MKQSRHRTNNTEQTKESASWQITLTYRLHRTPASRVPSPHSPSSSNPCPARNSRCNRGPDSGEQSYNGCGKLPGRVALITGADSGIGRATALAFAREGASVLVSYLNEDQDAQETKRLVEEAGQKAVLVAGDISDEGHCQQLVQRAVQEFGHIDILVNNAATQVRREKLEDISSSEFERVMRTNFFSMFYLAKAAVPHMQPGSCIINTASIQAYDPSADLLVYASSKGAITTFTKSLAKMLMEQGIRVNAVAPGPVWTPLIAATSPAKDVSTFGQNSLHGRPAQPVELAPLYVFLASPEASYVTGEVYGATGGRPIA